LSTTSAPASPIHRPSSPLRVALPPVTKDRERASSIEQRQFFLTGVCLREYSVLRTSRQQREQDLGQVRNNDHTRTLNTHPPPPKPRLATAANLTSLHPTSPSLPQEPTRLPTGGPLVGLRLCGPQAVWARARVHRPSFAIATISSHLSLALRDTGPPFARGCVGLPQIGIFSRISIYHYRRQKHSPPCCRQHGTE
jgi:hypothetical protein